MSTLPALSVVIPVLNESAALPRLLAQLRAQRGVSLDVIVADGGSTDGSRLQAQQGGARVVEAPRGRAAQMNAGARLAQHELLLFLHADSGLPDTGLLAHGLAAFAQQADARSAGHFGLRFVRTQPGHELFFRYLETKTRLNRKGTINGDQGLLIPARYFAELGGYDESLPFLEDARIAAKISAGGRWLLLPGELYTSARRFEAEGHARRYLLMTLIMSMHTAGATEFFARAPEIYRQQSATEMLRLRPFLQLARTVIRQRGRRKTWRVLGRYARENFWQWFLLRDVRRNDGRLSCLSFHDRHLAARLDHRAADTLAALLAAAWFYLWLPLRQP